MGKRIDMWALHNTDTSIDMSVALQITITAVEEGKGKDTQRSQKRLVRAGQQRLR